MTDAKSALQVGPAARDIPVLHYADEVKARPPLEHYQRFDELREQSPYYRGDIADFWVFTRAEDIKAAMSNPEVFSNSSIVHLEPETSYKLIPENLDPPQHSQWRKLLGPFFSPGAITERRQFIHDRCVQYIDEIAGSGQCDYLEDFAFKFPTSVFMDLMGFPESDTEQFLAWEDATVRAPDWSDQEQVAKGMGEILGYMGEFIAYRRKNPGTDIISQAVQWEIEDEPVSDADLQSLCLLLFLAGLDTVAIQLSFATMHFAIHREHQAQVRSNPELVPTAVEEMMRLYSIVTPARKVMKDTDEFGIPLRAGQMVWLPLWAGSRDPRGGNTEIALDRKNNPHLGFGSGVHRCLGAHLAREEMRTAFIEWHKRVPEYSLDPTRPISQRIASNMSIDSVPLLWKA